MNLETGLSLTPGGKGIPLDGLVDFLVMKPLFFVVMLYFEYLSSESCNALIFISGNTTYETVVLPFLGSKFAERGRILIYCFYCVSW